VGNAVGLFMLCIIVLIFYPLAIALRPLGEFGNKLFNLFNAALITTLVAPPFMAFFFVLPAFMQGLLPAVALVATPFFAIVGSLISMASPYIVFYLAYKKSSDVFGRLDDVSGKFDIGDMPPVSVGEMNNDVQKTGNSAHMAMIADTIGDAVLYNNDGKRDFFDDIVKPGVDYAATAATAAGHPYLGMAAKVATSAYDKARDKGKDSTPGPQPEEVN